MPTLSFETNLLTEITDYIAKHHKSLTATIPATATYVIGTTPNVPYRVRIPSPDIMVQNPATGAVLAVEVKGSQYAPSLPIAVLPQMVEIKDALAIVNGKVVLISATDIPDLVQEHLKNEDVQVERVSSVQEAIQRLEPTLSAMDKLPH